MLSSHLNHKRVHESGQQQRLTSLETKLDGVKHDDAAGERQHRHRLASVSDQMRVLNTEGDASLLAETTSGTPALKLKKSNEEMRIELSGQKVKYIPTNVNIHEMQGTTLTLQAPTDTEGTIIVRTGEFSDTCAIHLEHNSSSNSFIFRSDHSSQTLLLNAVASDDSVTALEVSRASGHVKVNQRLAIGEDAQTTSTAALAIGSASGTKGLLLPGGTTTQLNLLSNSAVSGMLLYNDTTHKACLSYSPTQMFHNIVTDKNSATVIHEIHSGQSIKSTPVTMTPTAAWQDLTTSDYPGLTIPASKCAANNIIEVRGSLAEDLPANKYGHMSSVFQYEVRCNGSAVGDAVVSQCCGGDNNIENTMGHFYNRVVVATDATEHQIVLRFKSATTNERNLVGCAQGSNSSLFVRVLKSHSVPIIA